ncbi:hypothetical protein SLEP1_g60366 [Rubroshorea leprosula]|uniref:Uncharacterized protein n=1 Tax=Rubroshorea leprosula TaxID=152421 RepID=A0AAV5MWR0_9ROSI|nr:hypothetical protein SLEP1_g60366 [Rubroshorea leprosula]
MLVDDIGDVGTRKAARVGRAVLHRSTRAPPPDESASSPSLKQPIIERSAVNKLRIRAF